MPRTESKGLTQKVMRCPKVALPGDLELCSCLAAAAGSLCVGHFTTDGFRGISMQNGMLLMNTGFLFSKGMFPFVLVTILNYLNYRAV